MCASGICRVLQALGGVLPATILNARFMLPAELFACRAGLSSPFVGRGHVMWSAEVFQTLRSIRESQNLSQP
jgi:hypothetical protein